MTVANGIYFGLDLSLSPGVAAIRVKNGKPALIAVSSAKTDAKMADATRAHVVESLVGWFAFAHGPFDTVIRESFTAGRNKRATQTIFAAWAAADKALHMGGYCVDKPPYEITPTEVKRIVGGHGRAEKAEVADGVRKILGLERCADGSPFTFKSDDESDAAAVVLAWLIKEGAIS